MPNLDQNSKKPQSAQAATSSQEAESLACPSLAMENVEALGNDLKRLLVHSESGLINTGVRQQIEQLERWIESYRRGLAAAEKISHAGLEMLTQARDQLNLAHEERLRLEDEGGHPATKEQAQQNEELAAALRRLNEIIPTVESSFQHHAEHEAA